MDPKGGLKKEQKGNKKWIYKKKKHMFRNSILHWWYPCIHDKFHVVNAVNAVIISFKREQNCIHKLHNNI